MSTNWRVQKYGSRGALLEAYRRGARPRLTFSPHAAARFKEMCLSEDELFQTIAHPTNVWLSPKYGAVNITAGRVTLALNVDVDGTPTVVTILWATREDWEEAQDAGVIGTGRTVKSETRSRGHRP